MKGVWAYFLITLRLNFRSVRSIAYGYVMPILFLFGFGSIFQSGEPRLWDQMGQLLTITILGGACLGMPTALVAEREKGLWRCYQLLPIPISRLFLGVLGARVLLVALAVVLQIVLAGWVYETPMPVHPILFFVGFIVVIYAFLGLGLIVTALAKDVPSVQALGQCLFLPMILIGGVGVPLVVLPDWAQVVASFMPGRYAVELLQAGYESGWQGTGFPIMSLLVIGTAAMIAGFYLIDWTQNVRLTRRSLLWLSLALFAWGVTGLNAIWLDRTEPLLYQGSEDYLAIDREKIDQIEFEPLPEDDGFYAPLAPPTEDYRFPFRMREFIPLLEQWQPGRVKHEGQRIRFLLSVAAIADVTQDPSERLVARVVFEKMKRDVKSDVLEQALAWVILAPEQGRIIQEASELGLNGKVHPQFIRERSVWYAKKFLGRLRGVIPDKEPSSSP